MIKNVVFDYGDTLIRFDQDAMLAPYIGDPADRALAAPVVFDRLYWDRLDRDAITREEMLEGFRARLPERLWQGAALTLDNWFFHVPEVPGMAALVQDVKRRYRRNVYMLSDVTAAIAPYLTTLPILRDLDGWVLSGAVGAAKPDPAIYCYLAAAYGVDLTECVFIDNLRRNVEGAERCGMRGYLFDGDAGKLAAYLDALLRDD